MSQTRKMRFNKRSLEALTPPDSGRVYVYDEATPSLCICLTAAGSRVFYSYRKIRGRPVRLRLGAFPELSVEQARKMTTKAAAAVAEGRDPHAERRTLMRGVTLGQVWEHWLENYATVHKKPVSVEEDRGLWRRYIARWKGRRIQSITRADVRGRHKAIGRDNGKYAANRMLSLLHTLFAHAASEDDIEWSGENPCKGVRRFKEQQRERFLQADEIPRFFQALADEPNPAIRDYFSLAILTGVRRRNLVRMRWDELHLDRSTWEVPDSKSGDPLSIHLPPEAVRILRERQQTTESEWVFPARTKTSKTPWMAGTYHAWERILDRAKLKDLRPHDLRRTLGSWQASLGVSLQIIGKSLGHRHQSSTAIYSRLMRDPVVDAVDRATAAMLAAAQNGKGGDDGCDR